MNNNCCSEISSLVFQSAERRWGRSAWPGMRVRAHTKAPLPPRQTQTRTHAVLFSLAWSREIRSPPEKGGRGVCGGCSGAVGSPYKKKRNKKTLQARIGLYTPQNPHTVSRETKNSWEDASCLLERQGELKVTDTSPVQDPLPGPMSRSCTPAQGT